MVPTSPEGSKGRHPSQHYSQDANEASSTKHASSDTEGWCLKVTQTCCIQAIKPTYNPSLQYLLH